MYRKLKERGIHHICLRIPNLEEAADFYLKTFGGEIICEWGNDENDDHSYTIDLGTGDFLEIYGSSTPYGLGKWQHVAIWVDNADEAFAKALANGAKVDSYPSVSHIPCRDGQIVHMKSGFLVAPGGEIVEVVEDIPADYN